MTRNYAVSNDDLIVWCSLPGRRKLDVGDNFLLSVRLSVCLSVSLRENMFMALFLLASCYTARTFYPRRKCPRSTTFLRSASNGTDVSSCQEATGHAAAEFLVWVRGEEQSASALSDNRSPLHHVRKKRSHSFFSAELQQM